MKQVFIVLALFCWGGLSFAQTVRLTPVIDRLVSPTGMVLPGRASDEMYLLEQRGLIYRWSKGALEPKPFLDIRSKITELTSRYDEKGLLGMAFHPKYAQNGRFFVYYSGKKRNANEDHCSVLSEFRYDVGTSRVVEGERRLLVISEPEWNHNGGQIQFGPDGYLYVGVGDGGSGGDPHGEKGNGQDLGTLLGKILRLDVDAAKPYGIPKDNPFVATKGAKPEIWAYGLRNPWRFSFDRGSGKLFCGDVGQNKYEEINIIERGKNYGWRIMEGLHCFNPSSQCPQDGLVMPIAEYDRSEGSSVTGGYVYRGKAMPYWVGTYIFADWRGALFQLKFNGHKWDRKPLEVDYANFKNLNINSLAEDAEGELYLVVQDLDGPFQASGMILKLVP